MRIKSSITIALMQLFMALAAFCLLPIKAHGKAEETPLKILRINGRGAGVVVSRAGSLGYLILTASHNLSRNSLLDGRLISIDELSGSSSTSYSGTSLNRMNRGLAWPLLVPTTTEAEGPNKFNIDPQNDFAVVLVRDPTFQPGADLVVGTSIMPLQEENQEVRLIGTRNVDVRENSGYVMPAEIATVIVEEWRKQTPSIKAFDPKVEYLIKVSEQVKAGMSGGGVFDEAGNLLGIMSRALSFTDGYGEESYFARAIRADYIYDQYTQQLSQLSYVQRENFENLVGNLYMHHFADRVTHKYQTECGKLLPQ